MKIPLLTVICVLLVGCSSSFKPKMMQERFDGPPFVVGDVVYLKNDFNRYWIVENIANGKVSVLRQPLQRHFWSSTQQLPVERETFPEVLLSRRVTWWDDEREPEKRKP